MNNVTPIIADFATEEFYVALRHNTYRDYPYTVSCIDSDSGQPISHTMFSDLSAARARYESECEGARKLAAC